MNKDADVACKKERKGIWLKIKLLFSMKGVGKNTLTKDKRFSSEDSSSYSSYSSQLTKSTVASAVGNDGNFDLSIPFAMDSAPTCSKRISGITSVYDNPNCKQFNYSSIEVLRQHNDNANLDDQSHNSRPSEKKRSPNRQRPSRARARTPQAARSSRGSRPRPRSVSGTKRTTSPRIAASGKESKTKDKGEQLSLTSKDKLEADKQEDENKSRPVPSEGNQIKARNKGSGRTLRSENKSGETPRRASMTPDSEKKPLQRSGARKSPNASQRSTRPMQRTSGRPMQGTSGRPTQGTSGRPMQGTGGRLRQRLPRQSAVGGGNIRTPRPQRPDDPRRIAGGILKAIDKPPPKVALGNKFCKKKLRRRNERLKRRVRRRLDFALQAMDSQSKIGFLIQNASKRTPLTYPMYPYFPNEWAKGCLPLQSRDPSVLIKLYTWLLGLEEVFRTMDKNDELKLRRKVACRLSAEDEVGAVKMISGQLRSENEKDYKAAWHVLSNDNYFKDYAAQRTYLERKEGMLLSIRSLKTTVKWQLENVCKGMFP